MTNSIATASGTREGSQPLIPLFDGSFVRQHLAKYLITPQTSGRQETVYTIGINNVQQENNRVRTAGTATYNPERSAGNHYRFELTGEKGNQIGLLELDSTKITNAEVASSEDRGIAIIGLNFPTGGQIERFYWRVDLSQINGPLSTDILSLLTRKNIQFNNPPRSIQEFRVQLQRFGIKDHDLDRLLIDFSATQVEPQTSNLDWKKNAGIYTVDRVAGTVTPVSPVLNQANPSQPPQVPTERSTPLPQALEPTYSSAGRFDTHGVNVVSFAQDPGGRLRRAINESNVLGDVLRGSRKYDSDDFAAIRNELARIKAIFGGVDLTVQQTDDNGNVLKTIT